MFLNTSWVKYTYTSIFFKKQPNGYKRLHRCTLTQCICLALCWSHFWTVGSSLVHGGGFVSAICVVLLLCTPQLPVAPTIPVWWGTSLPIISLLQASARNLPFILSTIVSVCYLCLCSFSPATAPTTHKHTFTSHLWAGLPCVHS